MKTRYRIYREHKYVLNFLADLEKFIATMDFRSDMQLNALSEKLNGLINLIEGHAEHEDKTIHQLLRDKKSCVQAKIEADHQLHHQILSHLKNLLNSIKASQNPKERIQLGYNFYLNFRKFEADHLSHINEEETIIMAELQRLYTDEELRKHIDFKTYSIMTTEEMLHMLEVLFPHYNTDDKITFLTDIKDAQPDKFQVIWPKILNNLLIESEKTEIFHKFMG